MYTNLVITSSSRSSLGEPRLWQNGRRVWGPEARLADEQVGGTTVSEGAKESNYGASFIPLYGSYMESKFHFQEGNYVPGVFWGAMFVSDFFLVKSLLMSVGRLTIRGATVLLAKNAETPLMADAVQGLRRMPSYAAREADNLLSELGAKEFIDLGYRIEPGVQLAQIDNWFVKRVNPGANWFRREWGAMSIEAQAKALLKLGADMAPEFFINKGMLFVRSVGVTGPRASSSTFLRAFFRGSYRMRTFLNDIRPRNMGVNGLIFDPALDPIMNSFFWSGMYLALIPARVAYHHDN